MIYQANRYVRMRLLLIIVLLFFSLSASAATFSATVDFDQTPDSTASPATTCSVIWKLDGITKQQATSFPGNTIAIHSIQIIANDGQTIAAIVTCSNAAGQTATRTYDGITQITSTPPVIPDGTMRIEQQQ